MSNSAWCDLNKDCTVLKLHDRCHNPKRNCQKQITFIPKQFQLEGGSIKSKLQKIFKGIQTAWKNFSKTALHIASPYLEWQLVPKLKIQRLDKQRRIF